MYLQEIISMKILFIGNSITTTDWTSDVPTACGLCASDDRHDYIAHVVNGLSGQHDRVESMRKNAAEFERHFPDFDLSVYKKQRDFDADVIVMRIIENCDRHMLETEDFGLHYKRCADFFNKSKKAKIICTGSFWQNDLGDAIIERIAGENGWPFVSLRSLHYENYHAIGKHERADVCAHPGDKGMAGIAALILLELNY